MKPVAMYYQRAAAGRAAGGEGGEGGGRRGRRRVESGGLVRGGEGGLTVELVRKRGWLPLSSTLRREKRARLPVCLLSSLFHPPPTFHPFSLPLSLSATRFFSSLAR